MLIFIISLISFLVYLFYLLIFYNGLSHKKPNYKQSNLTVSVIIAARNEEKNLPTLISDLQKQDYPKQLYEVIIADDNSEDNTESLIRKYSKNWTNLRYIKITDRNSVKSPKKNALSKAIKASRGELLLLTDADCILPEKWISSMTAQFNEKISMVCGFSRTKIDKWNVAKFISKFEYFDFFVMYSAAAGAISSGYYFSCSGQNIAYKRKDFYEVGGFRDVSHIQSGDDVNLLQLFRKSNKNVVFSFDENSFIYTKPITNLKSFINQRVRWASNYKYQTTLNPVFFAYLTFTFILTLFLYILPFINMIGGLTILLLKFTFDLIFVKKAAEIFKIENERLYFFPIWFFLQPFYIVAVTILGIFEFFKWKS